MGAVEEAEGFICGIFMLLADSNGFQGMRKSSGETVESIKTESEGIKE